MILARFYRNTPIIKYSGDLTYNLMLAGCIMKDMAKTIMQKRGCTYEYTIKFVCDLLSKLVYKKKMEKTLHFLFLYQNDREEEVFSTPPVKGIVVI